MAESRLSMRTQSGELDEYLIKELKALKNTEMDELLDKRYNKYRKVGKFV